MNLLSFSNPGPGIQFLVDPGGDTLGVIIGTDTFAMLSVGEVRNVNITKITLNEFRERNDSLLSMIKTCREINHHNDRIIFSQGEESRLRGEASQKDQQIIASLEGDVNREKKKSIPWKIATGILLIVGILKL